MKKYVNAIFVYFELVVSSGFWGIKKNPSMKEELFLLILMKFNYGSAIGISQLNFTS